MITDILTTIGAGLNSALSGIRGVIFSATGNDLGYGILAILSLVGAIFIVKKFIVNWRDIFSKRYIGWSLLIALIIFLLISF